MADRRPGGDRDQEGAASGAGSTETTARSPSSSSRPASNVEASATCRQSCRALWRGLPREPSLRKKTRGSEPSSAWTSAQSERRRFREGGRRGIGALTREGDRSRRFPSWASLARSARPIRREDGPGAQARSREQSGGSCAWSASFGCRDGRGRSTDGHRGRATRGSRPRLRSVGSVGGASGLRAATGGVSPSDRPSRRGPGGGRRRRRRGRSTVVGPSRSPR